MCGIAGFINCNRKISIQKVKEALRHRGPDENGEYIYKNVVLVHTRLAVQDILHGHQPFEFEDYVIVFNGEIYNVCRV